MIERYWERVGGTLVPEFQAVPRSQGVGRRLLDAVILPDLPRKRAHWRHVNLAGQRVIVVQAKAHRLGMYLMGQAIFSAQLVRTRFAPVSVRSVILCSKDDTVLRKYLASYPDVEVVVDEVAPADGGTVRSTGSWAPAAQSPCRRADHRRFDLIQTTTGWQPRYSMH